MAWGERSARLSGGRRARACVEWCPGGSDARGTTAGKIWRKNRGAYGAALYIKRLRWVQQVIPGYEGGVFGMPAPV